MPHLQSDAMGDVEVGLNKPVPRHLAGVHELFAGDRVERVQRSLEAKVKKNMGVGLSQDLVVRFGYNVLRSFSAWSYRDA